MTNANAAMPPWVNTRPLEGVFPCSTGIIKTIPNTAATANSKIIVIIVEGFPIRWVKIQQDTFLAKKNVTDEGLPDLTYINTMLC